MLKDQFDLEIRKLVESPYMTALKVRVAELRAAEEARRPLPLSEQIRAWWQSLPPEDRKEAYLLAELRQIFRVGPQRLGMALHEAGFRRVRRWQGPGPYQRRWLPPTSSPTAEPSDNLSSTDTV